MIPGRFITGRFNGAVHPADGSSQGQFNTGRFIPEREKQLAAGVVRYRPSQSDNVSS